MKKLLLVILALAAASVWAGDTITDLSVSGCTNAIGISARINVK